MTTEDRVELASQPLSDRTSPRIMRELTRPAVDRAIAVVAVLPFFYGLYHRLTNGTLNIPRVAASLSLLLVIVTTLFRRAPQRVTPNPLWWLLAFLVTYGPLTWAVLAPVGPPVVPALVFDVLAIVSLAIVVYARLSLGRNIGFVPAQRRIVRSGAYGYVRHPIYTGLLLSWSALVLRLWNPINVGIFLTIVVLVVIKSIVEENFLRQDPEYAEYMCVVRYRYVPGVV